MIYSEIEDDISDDLPFEYVVGSKVKINENYPEYEYNGEIGVICRLPDFCYNYYRVKLLSGKDTTLFHKHELDLI